MVLKNQLSFYQIDDRAFALYFRDISAFFDYLKNMNISDAELRDRLKSHGITAGPITESTRKVYLNHLAQLDRSFKGSPNRGSPIKGSPRKSLADSSYGKTRENTQSYIPPKQHFSRVSFESTYTPKTNKTFSVVSPLLRKSIQEEEEDLSQTPPNSQEINNNENYSPEKNNGDIYTNENYTSYNKVNLNRSTSNSQPKIINKSYNNEIIDSNVSSMKTAKNNYDFRSPINNRSKIYNACVDAISPLSKYWNTPTEESRPRINSTTPTPAQKSKRNNESYMTKHAPTYSQTVPLYKQQVSSVFSRISQIFKSPLALYLLYLVMIPIGVAFFYPLVFHSVHFASEFFSHRS